MESYELYDNSIVVSESQIDTAQYQYYIYIKANMTNRKYRTLQVDAIISLDDGGKLKAINIPESSFDKALLRSFRRQNIFEIKEDGIQIAISDPVDIDKLKKVEHEILIDIDKKYNIVDIKVN